MIRKSTIKTNAGSSSILVILIMLTVIVFGVLAMMASFSGYKLSKKNAQVTKERYEVEGRVEKILYSLDNKLKSVKNSKTNAFTELKNEIIKNNTDIVFTIANTNSEVLIAIPYRSYSQNKHLDVKLKIIYPKDATSNASYKIVSMKEIYNPPAATEDIGFSNPFQ